MFSGESLGEGMGLCATQRSCREFRRLSSEDCAEDCTMEGEATWDFFFFYFLHIFELYPQYLQCTWGPEKNPHGYGGTGRGQTPVYWITALGYNRGN